MEENIMDFFEVARTGNATDYVGCISVLMGAQFSGNGNLMLGNTEIEAFPPEKGKKENIRKTSRNFLAAAVKEYPNLEKEDQKMLEKVLRNFMKKGYLKMNGLGILDVCSKADKEGILKVLETNKE